MVTRDVLFEKMIATAILLSMDGIITSFSGLKLRLTNTLDQLCHSLLAAAHRKMMSTDCVKYSVQVLMQAPARRLPGSN
nr:hypothetical protein [Cronobacter dublinensis]